MEGWRISLERPDYHKFNNSNKRGGRGRDRCLKTAGSRAGHGGRRSGTNSDNLMFSQKFFVVKKTALAMRTVS